MKKTKKSISLIMAILMVISIIPFSASAIVYSGTFGADNKLKWEFNSKTDHLVITGVGEIPDYSIAVEPWYTHRLSVKSVTIKKGVTLIGKSTFKGHDYLQQVNLSSSVKTIDDAAFKGCNKLETINLYYVTKIGESAFENCRNLKEVIFSPELKAINDKTFEGCWNLKSINLPGKLETIGEHAFYYCYLVEDKEIIIPDSVTTIGIGAFFACGISSLHIGSGVTEIPMAAFASNDLETLYIPANVKKISSGDPIMLNEGAFSRNYDLETIYTESTQMQYFGPLCFDYSTYDEDGHTAVGCPVKDIYCNSTSLNHAFDDYVNIHYNHSHDTINDVTNNSCQDIIVSSSCKICTVNHSSIIPATETHRLLSENIQDATCTTEGSVKTYCLDCSFETHMIGYADDNHTGIYVSKSATSATCTSDGWTEEQKCRDCKKIVISSKKIPATQHKNKYPCDLAPSCTKEGYIGSYYCPDCYKYLTDGATVIPATGHQNTSSHARVDSTCTSYGREAGVYCNDCKTWVEGGKQIGYKSHSYGDWYITESATCKTNKDKKERKCSSCGKTETTTTPSNTPRHPDDNQNGICDLCSKDFKKDCTHHCHEDMKYGINQKGSVMYRIRLFFWKLFKIKKICDCGMAHY